MFAVCERTQHMLVTTILIAAAIAVTFMLLVLFKADITRPVRAVSKAKEQTRQRLPLKRREIDEAP